LKGSKGKKTAQNPPHKAKLLSFGSWGKKERKEGMCKGKGVVRGYKKEICWGGGGGYMDIAKDQ